MAVHLNARLNTKFVPILFATALLTSLLGSRARASLETAAEPPAPEYGLPQGAPPMELDEVRALGTDPERVDRRPGITPITMAGAGDSLQAPADRDQATESDRLQMQPSEAAQR
jgi:hypothetical protein